MPFHTGAPRSGLTLRQSRAVMSLLRHAHARIDRCGQHANQNQLPRTSRCAPYHLHDRGTPGCQTRTRSFMPTSPARRTIVWDVSAGVELAELPPSGNWNFAAAWSPTNPGVFATASFDGKARLPHAVMVQRGILS